MSTSGIYFAFSGLIRFNKINFGVIRSDSDSNNHCLIPIAPHLLFPQFMDDGDLYERELALFFGKVLLSKCAEVWVFGEKLTPGMAREIGWAERYGKQMKWFTTDCIALGGG